MAQNLILPINKCLVTAGYKSVAYKARFKFTHYGVDLVSLSGTKTVFANGSGTVLSAGTDSILGNALVVRYNGVTNHDTGIVRDVIARYYHLASILVKPGAQVTSDTEIGLYGNTGKYSTGAHLHIEFDTNIAAPLTSKTGSRGSTLITAASSDTSLNPFSLLHRKASAPDNQQISVDKGRYQGNFYAQPECAAIPTLE